MKVICHCLCPNLRQMTSSGIVGKIENVKDRYVLIRLGDNVTINMQKEFISSLLPKGTINNIETQ